MPNGGTDCCGFCWFNRTNRGRRNWSKHRDRSIPPHCEIRDIDLPDPAYTYCATPPHRRPFRDRIPIGPVMTGDACGNRKLWLEVQDSPEIRQHHLDLLWDVVDGKPAKDWYPLGLSLLTVVVWQVGQWHERRAIPALEALVEKDTRYENLVKSTIEQILSDK